MNVLLLSPLPPPYGGMARWSETVIDCCRDAGDISLDCIDTGHKVKDIVNRTVWQRYVHSVFRIVQIVREISYRCRKTGYQVAHVASSAENGLIRDFFILKALKRRGIKVVYHLHFGRYAEIKKAKTMEYRLLNSNMKKVDMVMAMDPITFNAIDNSFNKVFIPNPIRKEEFHISNRKKAIFIGYVVKNKGIEELLSAWGVLEKKYEGWTLQIVGQVDIEYLEYLKEKHPCVSVSFLGELEHETAMKHLRDSSVFVLPSYTEGFPYSVCEAMYSGKAIVSTIVGAIPFMLAENCGVVCPPQDSESLLSSLEKVMGDEQYRILLGNNAALRAQHLFSPEIVIKQYIDSWAQISC
ncbi:MAG: glycosyltransferase family 4 protein [Spirochaetales bacterium]|nr:glycosyltransferase family 4 protein [Spirochaetales bacterium]